MVDINQDEQEDLDRDLILLFQQFKRLNLAEDLKISDETLKKDFIAVIKDKLDVLDLNCEICQGCGYPENECVCSENIEER